MIPQNQQQKNDQISTVTTSKTPDFDTRVVVASKEVKLMYAKDLRTQWKQLVSKINILLGGNELNMPTFEELDVMINYALDNWYNLSLNEIELAVQANISRKTHEFVQFYGKISVSYLQACISNYHEVKRKAILEAKRKEESLKTRTHNTEPDEVVNYKLWEGLCKFVEQQGRIPEIWDWTRCYEHLETEKGQDWIGIEEKKHIHAEQTAKFQASQNKDKQRAQTVEEIREIMDVDAERQIVIACKRFIVERELRVLFGI